MRVWCCVWCCGVVCVPPRTAGFGAYAEDKSRFHEAGFDALITGVAYLRMAYHLGAGHHPATLLETEQPLKTWRVRRVSCVCWRWFNGWGDRSRGEDRECG